MTTRVDLVAKAGCHLCDEARAVVERVCGELGVEWAERNLGPSPDDPAAFAEMVPVVLVNGVVHGYWRIDEVRLRRALTAP